MSSKEDEKAARLAAALRENLKRRKGRERAVNAAETGSRTSDEEAKR